MVQIVCTGNLQKSFPHKKRTAHTEVAQAERLACEFCSFFEGCTSAITYIAVKAMSISFRLHLPFSRPAQDSRFPNLFFTQMRMWSVA